MLSRSRQKACASRAARGCRPVRSLWRAAPASVGGQPLCSCSAATAKTRHPPRRHSPRSFAGRDARRTPVGTTVLRSVAACRSMGHPPFMFGQRGVRRPSVIHTRWAARAASRPPASDWRGPRVEETVISRSRAPSFDDRSLGIVLALELGIDRADGLVGWVDRSLGRDMPCLGPTARCVTGSWDGRTWPVCLPANSDFRL